MLVVWLLLAAVLQDYTQRGFVENRAAIYPQTAPNDDGRFVGESLFRYDGFYKPSPALQLSGTLDLRIDTHHQVDRDFSVPWLDRELQRPLVAVRRLSALYHGGPITIEAGKQFIRWGKTDILTPTDRFAPRDFLTVFDNDFLAVTAARLTYERGADTIDFVWVPRFTPSRVPLINQRWVVVPDGIQLPDAGVQMPEGQQAGLRWSRTGVVEYSASFYQGFNHLPSFAVTQRGGLLRFYPGMRMIGGDVTVPLPWLSIKGEAAHFGSSDEGADEYVQYVIQLERQAGEWFFVGGYAGEAVTANGIRAGEFAPDRGFAKTILGRAGYTIDTNRSIAFESTARQNGDGFWSRFEYSQAFGQHWRATLGISLVRGEPDDFIGQYHRNSNVGIILRYSF